MEAFLPDWLKVLSLAIFGLLLALGAAARRRPDIDWLRPFRTVGLRIETPVQAAVRRRHLLWLMGFELILAAVLCVTACYALSIMTFNLPDDREEQLLIWAVAGVMVVAALGCFWTAAKS